MLSSLNIWFTRLTSHPDAAKLLLRIVVAGLMLFHGVAKLQHGIGWIGDMLIIKGYPYYIAYGAYIGEVIAPLFILLGLFTRPMALILSFNMLVAISLFNSNNMFTLIKFGAWGLEVDAFFFFGGLIIMLLGSGRFSVTSNHAYQ